MATLAPGVVLYGGRNALAPDQLLADTWVYDVGLGTWAFMGAGPPARERHAMAVNSGPDGGVVLFGGTNGSPLNDTWEWDGFTWTQLTPATPAPYSVGDAAAWDAIGQGVLLSSGGTSGGGKQTTRFELPNPASYTIFQQGCAGPNGTVTLVPLQMPYLGATFSVQLQNLPQGGTAFFVWDGVRLPAPFVPPIPGLLPGCEA
jgi:hypothetical protein